MGVMGRHFGIQHLRPPGPLLQVFRNLLKDCKYFDTHDELLEKERT